MNQTNNNGNIKVSTSDNKVYEIKNESAKMMNTLVNMMSAIDQDDLNENIIKLPDIEGDILKIVIDYCDYHVANPPVVVPSPYPVLDCQLCREEYEEEHTNVHDENMFEKLPKHDQELLPPLIDENNTLSKVLLAANYLDIKQLVDAAGKTFGKYIKENKLSDIRKQLGWENDYLPTEGDDEKTIEEKEDEYVSVIEENSWAYKNNLFYDNEEEEYNAMKKRVEERRKKKLGESNNGEPTNDKSNDRESNDEESNDGESDTD